MGDMIVLISLSKKIVSINAINTFIDAGSLACVREVRYMCFFIGLGFVEIS